jgi:hypothetical protein
MRLAVCVVLVLSSVACRGIVSSRTEVTPPPQVASSARVTNAGVPNVAIDRTCSKLGDASDEYVCLTNADTTPVNMGAWVLRNVMGRSYDFPQGFTLAPGQTVKVHTGPGSDTATDLHCSYSVNPAWDKDDKLTLHNNEDVEVFVSDPTKQ